MPSWYPKQLFGGGAGKIEGLHDDLRAHVDYAARTSHRLARGLFHAMARFGPKLDREQLLLSRFCRNRDGTFRNQRDLFVRAIENESRRTGGRSSFAGESFLPLGEVAHRSSFRRHECECRPQRLRLDAGAARRKTRLAGKRHRLIM